MTDHVFRHRCLGNLDTQFQEFTANPRRAPDDVLAAHGSNQLTSFPRNLRPSRSAVTNLPGPIPLESSAVPTDDSFRFNDDQGGTPSRPESRQPNPKTPIGTIEQESFGIWSSLEHGQLITERNDFGLKPGLLAKAGEHNTKRY